MIDTNPLPDNDEFDSTDWVNLARIAYEESESFLDATQRERWTRNYSLSQSEHPEGSKYLTEAFTHRSKAFRGKTESAIRKAEAAFVVAMFSNKSAVAITAENQGDKQADEAAVAVHKMVNYRLGRKDTHWFKTSLGAYHEAQINGNVVSEQYWEYRKVDGEVIDDKPVIKLYPLEHVHISPSAGWLDPINTSPYLIIDIPMFVGGIKARMEDDWKTYPDETIKAAIDKINHKTVQRARVGEKQSIGEDQPSSVTEFDIAYVHKVFIRQEDTDWFYFTLGNNHLLSDPAKVTDVYPHLPKNKRPFVWGGITIEPHKVYNRAMVDRVFTAQTQINDVSNQRFDNVRQVLNKRKYVLRNRGVDYASLVKNISGGLVFMDEMDAVKEEKVTDITGSSYREQDLLNSDFDELSGTFSNASVDSNRNLNETVGGMQLLKGESSALTEYQLMIFVMTWVESVVDQMAALVQYYEDDDIIKLIAGEEHTHETVQAEIEVNADVGMGATDPQSRVTNLVMGIRTVLEVFPQLQGQLNGGKVVEEVFGAIGYSDGSKFFIEEEEGVSPEVQQLQQAVQELQSILATDQAKTQNKLQADLMLEDKKSQTSMNELLVKLQSERQMGMTKLALESGQKVRAIASQTGSDEKKFSLDIAKEANKRLDIETKRAELRFKMESGRDGI